MNSSSNAIRAIERLKEARTRTLALVADLDDGQLIGPRLEIINPLRWEIGHVAWFQEYWILRHLHQRAAILAYLFWSLIVHICFSSEYKFLCPLI